MDNIIIAIIQARLKSKRLESKILYPLLHSTVLNQLIRRVKKSKLINDFILAIPDTEALVISQSINEYIHIIPGSEYNVLSRFYKAIETYKTYIDPIDTDNNIHIVRITADCPLIDPYLIDLCIEYYLNNPIIGYCIMDNISNPKGFEIEIFTYDYLKVAANNTCIDDYDREHVTPKIRELAKYNSSIYGYTSNLPVAINFSLDTIKDYILISSVYEYFNNTTFTIKDISQYMEDKGYKLYELINGLGYNKMEEKLILDIFKDPDRNTNKFSSYFNRVFNNIT